MPRIDSSHDACDCDTCWSKSASLIGGVMRRARLDMDRMECTLPTITLPAPVAGEFLGAFESRFMAALAAQGVGQGSAEASALVHRAQIAGQRMSDAGLIALGSGLGPYIDGVWRGHYTPVASA